MIQEINLRGFTLLELLVVIVIIGILGAIMLPQYQRAVLKSRYAGLMPIAKAMADSNEAYFLEHGVYAANAQELPVQGRQNYPDGTELEFGTNTDYSYVLATRDNNFPNNYIVYQKHSTNYPGEIHCEADANDTQAQDVCKSFGPTADIGETLTSGYLTYVLSGTGNGAAPAPVCEGAACDAQGNITECNSGQTLHNGSCEDCATAFPGAATCSSTSYAPLSCSTGYNLTDTGCVEAPACPAGSVCNAQGTVTSCNTGYYLNNGACAAIGGCPKSMLGQTTALSQATCTQVCDDTEDPACYKWTDAIAPSESYGRCNSSLNNNTAYACAGSTFDTSMGVCYGTAANVCADNTFKNKSQCWARYPSGANACTGSTFESTSPYTKPFCRGDAANGCAHTIFLGHAYCYNYTSNGCAETRYGYATLPSGEKQLACCRDAGAGGCPTGTPKCGNGQEDRSYGNKWWGDCCKTKYMLDGVCPSGVTECAS